MRANLPVYWNGFYLDKPKAGQEMDGGEMPRNAKYPAEILFQMNPRGHFRLTPVAKSLHFHFTGKSF